MERRETIVSVNQLVKRYGPIVALDGVSFDISRGEVFALLGPNGAGKTTTVEILEGLRQPDAGQVSICGYDPRMQPQEVKQIIGVQLQGTAFYRKITINELLKQFAGYYRRHVAIEDLLELVGLAERRTSRIEQLSGGQRQRLALALALLNDPEVVFLDEPTTGLDAQARRQLWGVIEQMKQLGKTILLTTHYIEEAERLADRVAILDRGTLIALDTPAALMARASERISVSFRALKPLSWEALQRLPSLLDLRETNGQYVLQVGRPGPAVIELIKLLETEGNELLELHVGRASLEDVFLRLTGTEIPE
jgi:ABC-2 type transport system ATP-binding protein